MTMTKINTSSWKSFVVGDLFDIHPTKAYKMTNAQLMDNGDNPVVVNSSYNNGIGGYSSQKVTENGGMITFSDTTTADAIFYQPNDFIGYPHVQGMYPKGAYAASWQESRLLFFVAAFRKAAVIRGFDYAYKFTREIASTMEVPLPVDTFGVPDWAYMDEYMSRTIKESEINLERLMQADSTKHAIDVTTWKKFHLYDDGLFNIDMGTKLDRVKMTQANPEVNFVGRANTNNGITACVDSIPGVTPYNAGNLTLSLGGEYLGSCFVQPEKFYTSQNVAVLIPQRDMSLGVKQFISTMIFRESRIYYKAFIDELNRHIKTDFSFYLPIDALGEPDWLYMDNYMHEAIKSAQRDLTALDTIG